MRWGGLVFGDDKEVAPDCPASGGTDSGWYTRHPDTSPTPAHPNPDTHAGASRPAARAGPNACARDFWTGSNRFDASLARGGAKKQSTAWHLPGGRLFFYIFQFIFNHFCILWSVLAQPHKILLHCLSITYFFTVKCGSTNIIGRVVLPPT